MDDIPATLGEAIGSEPLWLTAWLMLLVGTIFSSIFFTVYKNDDGWGFRWEPLAILLGFFVSGTIMEYMYGQMGYVRLLGLAHLIGWAPIYGWLAFKRKAIGFSTVWGKYVHVYLLIAGISLVVDSIDTVRYLAGDDGSLYLRWN